MTIPVLSKAGFIFCFEALPEVTDKRSYFMDECGWPATDYATVRNHKWFIAKVTVWKDGVQLGVEYCGKCCFPKVADFYTKGSNDEFMGVVEELMKKAATAIRFQNDPHGTKLKKQIGMNRGELSARLAAHYSRKLNGKVSCSFFDNMYWLSATGLPAHPSVAESFPNGWNMSERLSEEEAIKEVAEFEPA